MAQFATTQRPPWHAAEAWGSWPQSLPQVPQFFMSPLTLVSQPLASMPSQFLKPGLQEASPHIPTMQPGIPLGTEQRLPHMPQLPTSLPTPISHPSAGLPLQSSKPGVHGPILQTPAPQDAAALAKAHTLPQAPHAFTSLFLCTQLEAQQAAS